MGGKGGKKGSGKGGKKHKGGGKGGGKQSKGGGKKGGGKGFGKAGANGRDEEEIKTLDARCIIECSIPAIKRALVAAKSKDAVKEEDAAAGKDAATIAAEKKARRQ